MQKQYNWFKKPDFPGKSENPGKIRKSREKSGFLKTVIVPLLRDDDHQHPAPELSSRQPRQPLQMLEAAGEATVI